MKADVSGIESCVTLKSLGFERIRFLRDIDVPFEGALQTELSMITKS